MPACTIPSSDITLAQVSRRVHPLRGGHSAHRRRDDASRQQPSASRRPADLGTGHRGQRSDLPRPWRGQSGCQGAGARWDGCWIPRRGGAARRRLALQTPDEVRCSAPRVDQRPDGSAVRTSTRVRPPGTCRTSRQRTRHPSSSRSVPPGEAATGLRGGGRPRPSSRNAARPDGRTDGPVAQADAATGPAADLSSPFPPGGPSAPPARSSSGLAPSRPGPTDTAASTASSSAGRSGLAR